MTTIDRAAAIRAIVYLCAAQVLVQIGAFFWPALLPDLMARWSLTNSEAGWITAAFYGAYIVAVPVLVTLTDRVDAKHVYLAGVAMTVVGHALFAALADGFWSAFAARALTGVDTDRLPEEKRRGITIELGFAPLHLEGIGTVGVVDVPGHEGFVRTMLAGATGVDLALLVIAADEGVMPQTREHLAICSLLHIKSGLIALTKTDLAEPDWM